jgi:ATP-dependent Lhr-like helicase
MINVFSKLDPRIQDILKDKKINKPTEPQIIAIPPILERKNVLLIAPTGLGKTESALLPIFHNFLEQKEKNTNEKSDGISILYITPLRALNRDMLRRTIEWGEELGINIAVRHGDTSQSERARQSRSPPDMLITTPETFQILFTGKRLRNHLKKINFVIVDEIHELAVDERGAQLSVGLERLYELTKKEGHTFQRIGLSATVGTPKEVAKFLGGVQNSKFRDVKILQVDVTKHIDIKVRLPKIEKSDYKLSNKLSIEPISFSSLRVCKDLVDEHVSTLIFINTRDGAEILASRFHQWVPDFSVDVHHGSLAKISRIEAEDNFKSGKLKSLICTSSLELGIDVGNTDFVIQYNSPREVKRILQRVGRSGHKIGKVSKGLIIATHPEDLAESLVITKRALKGELESVKVRQNPLSVLTNQIISIALEYGKISPDKAYSIIKRAYPFYNLKEILFEQIVEQLKIQRNIWIDEQKNIVKRAHSRNYFLDNISMIPDEKSYIAVDISTRKRIGKLDESFVLNLGFEGATFILGGRPWTIVKSEDEEILVAQSKELGNAPSWTGEEIPVPFKVALEVGKLRRLTKKIKSDYPCDDKSFKQFEKQIENQKKLGFSIPSDKTITIDVEDKTIVINACFGTKVNETLGRLISAMIAQMIGESVGINCDSYRINMEMPGRIPPKAIKKILLNLKPESLEYMLYTILKNSSYIRYELVHTGRKFGAIRKDFDSKNVSMKKMASLFENSLIYDEAIEKMIWERMDIENTKFILDEIQKENIKIKIQKLSPISIANLETIRGLMVPKRADRAILMALKKRLEETEISLVCANCNHKWDTTVRRSDENPKCPKCSAIKIAVLRRYNKELIKILKKRDRTEQEEKELKRIIKNASLVLSYGRPALLALVGRGIGPDTAARILRKFNINDLKKSEEVQIKFLREILKAELNYARTRGFWDNA